MQADRHVPRASALSGWRRSSHSGGGDDHGPGDCLEVADGHPGVRPVRDSTRPHGPALVFTDAAWGAFVATL